jgi:hypothetical protein
MISKYLPEMQQSFPLLEVHRITERIRRKSHTMILKFVTRTLPEMEEIPERDPCFVVLMISFRSNPCSTRIGWNCPTNSMIAVAISTYRFHDQPISRLSAFEWTLVAWSEEWSSANGGKHRNRLVGG